MSQGRAIDPLPLDNFPQESDTQDPGFEELFAQLVGDAGTPADGFEDDLAIANSLLDSLDAALSGLGGQATTGSFLIDVIGLAVRFPFPVIQSGNLDDTFADILALDPAPAGDDVVNLSAAIPDFQSNIDNLGTLITGAGLPAPPSGGGGAVVCDLTCTLSNGAPNTPIHPFTIPVLNNDTKPVNLVSITLTQDTPGVFSITHNCPASLAAGAQCLITVNISPKGVGTYHGTIAVDFGGGNVAHGCLIMSISQGGTQTVFDCSSPPPPSGGPVTGPGGGGTGGPPTPKPFVIIRQV